MTARIRPAPEAVDATRTFLLSMWRERAAERGQPVPDDLSGACKFAAAFAQGVFGGEIAAHDLHAWLVIDGEVLDLCRDAADAREMAEGRIPASLAGYATAYGIGLPETGLHTPDPTFMRSRDFRSAMAANAPRVADWLSEFRRLHPRHDI